MCLQTHTHFLVLKETAVILSKLLPYYLPVFDQEKKKKRFCQCKLPYKCLLSFDLVSAQSNSAYNDSGAIFVFRDLHTCSSMFKNKIRKTSLSRQTGNPLPQLFLCNEMEHMDSHMRGKPSTTGPHVIQSKTC